MLIGQRCTGHEGQYKYHEFAHKLDGAVDVSISQVVWFSVVRCTRHIRHVFYVLEWCELEI